ncbi:MAG: hypothetical protein JKX81_11900 [Arenicella sp.]|nr:hypothetical protein [Arenicella sp.]
MVKEYPNFAFFLKRCLPTKTDIVWLILLSMLCNAVLPLPVNAAPYNPGTSTSATPKQALMCTSRGYRWVNVSSLTETKVDSAHCLMCLMADHDSSAVHSSHRIHRLQQSHQFHAITALADFPSTHPKLPRVRAPPTIL